MKTIIHKLQFGTIPPKNRRRKRPTTNASNGSEGPPPSGPNFPYIEVVNGRAAMYGSVLGLTNWGLTGLNVVEQMSYPPFSLIGLGCTLLATYSVGHAWIMGEGGSLSNFREEFLHLVYCNIIFKVCAYYFKNNTF